MITSTNPYSLSSTTEVKFTSEQLLDIALNTLAEAGTEFDSDTQDIKSVINSKGLSITITTKTEKVKRKPRKVTAKKSDPKKEEPKVTKPTSTSDGITPFASTSDTSNEATIDAVKEEAGVPKETAFSAAAVGTEPVKEGDAPAFNFATT